MAGNERGLGDGGGGVLNSGNNGRIHWVIQPDRTNEMSQTNRVVQQVYVEVMPGVQSTHSRALHVRRGKKILQDLQNLNNTAINRAMVSFKGTRKKSAMTFVNHLGISQEDTMGPLWRQTLGRSLGSHDAAELVGGMCYGNGCRQETTRLQSIPCTTAEWSSLAHSECSTRHWLDPFPKEKCNFLSKIHGPSERELAN